MADEPPGTDSKKRKRGETDKPAQPRKRGPGAMGKKGVPLRKFIKDRQKKNKFDQEVKQDMQARTVQGRKNELGGLHRMYKLRIHASADQRSVILQLMHKYRKVYNLCVAMLRKRRGWHNFQRFRTWLVRKRCIRRGQAQWAFDMHNKFVAQAIKEAVVAHNGRVSRRSKTGKFGRLNFKSVRKMTQLTLPIEAGSAGPVVTFRRMEDACGKRGARRRAFVYMPFLGFDSKEDNTIKIRDKEWVIEALLQQHKPIAETKIVFEKRGSCNMHLLVIIPKKVDLTPMPDEPKIVALDPGVKQFQAFYSPNDGGSFGFLAHDQVARINSVNERLDRMHRMHTENKKIHKILCSMQAPERKGYKKHRRSQQRLRRAMHRKRKRLKDFITEVHWQSFRFLFEHYNVILHPEFESARMSRRRKTTRRINRGTVRNMATWSHYTFRNRVAMKVEEAPLRRLQVVTQEPGTSRQCGDCYYWFEGLGGARVFHCPACHIVYDRDIGAARNNLLCNLGRCVPGSS